ncbi:DEAD/DEAH box helicase [Paraneptunicella aestuarii]|uniref:DEAD/DEAH box helicase n=1 Tax=Paraneptunicella aestuarii TaxID=2831148 RepID=UPI001E5E7FC4|nr:DEAD/DEAH box helicase [Paraneptunicella aestuarii]UAA40201.1 DEAD/DEAH box helicase [Paraneptunicella aestuarii]
MLFSDLPLDNRLQKILALKEFTTVTPIQQQAIPHALLGKDLLASSKTGSGKTLAFLIPAIHRTLTQKALSKRDARVLVLAPTRELAKQVFNELLQLIKNTPLKAALLVGGDNYNDQAKTMNKNPAFVVGTPGRVADHLQGKSLFLNGLEMLILDEADRMLDLGFQEQLKQINQAADHRKRQTMMFSATMHSVLVNDLASELQKQPLHINIDASDQANADIKQHFYFADHIEHKELLLKHLLNKESFKQAIIFTATREDTSRLSELCQKWGINSTALSGELIQSKRAAIMQDFSLNKHQLLVTTDVASRGLDIPTVSLVINFDLPKTADEYIHRIGRTGRSGNEGTAIALVGPKDWRTFTLLKQQLQQEFNFETVEELPAKFSGFKENQPRPSGNKQSDGKSGSAAVKKKPRKTVLVKTMEGKDVGDAPFLKKKKRPTLDQEIQDFDDDIED